MKKADEIKALIARLDEIGATYCVWDSVGNEHVNIGPPEAGGGFALRLIQILADQGLTAHMNEELRRIKDLKVRASEGAANAIIAAAAKSKKPKT